MPNKPDILIIMVDQLNGTLFDHGPQPFLNSPHLKNLIENSICFSTCYTASPVSTIDVTPTLAALAGINLDEIMLWTDGNNLFPLIDKTVAPPPVFMEHATQGSIAPLVALRDADFKFIHCPVDPPRLFDLASDPNEMQNLADDPIYADKMAHFTDFIKA